MNDALTLDAEAKKITIITIEPLKVKTKRKFDSKSDFNLSLI